METAAGGLKRLHIFPEYSTQKTPGDRLRPNDDMFVYVVLIWPFHYVDVSNPPKSGTRSGIVTQGNFYRQLIERQPTALYAKGTLRSRTGVIFLNTVWLIPCFHKYIKMKVRKFSFVKIAWNQLPVNCLVWHDPKNNNTAWFLVTVSHPPLKSAYYVFIKKKDNTAGMYRSIGRWVESFSAI